MAHGDKTYLKVKDGEIHRRSELLQPFVDIDWLKNKPKLFFIQACANKRESRLSLIGNCSSMSHPALIVVFLSNSQHCLKVC